MYPFLIGFKNSQNPSLFMIKKKTCLDCKKQFEYNFNPKYTRKYCDSCSKKRKKMWENQWKVKYEDLDGPDE
jgi:hypothetical protein